VILDQLLTDHVAEDQGAGMTALEEAPGEIQIQTPRLLRKISTPPRPSA
jgi:hypothetical protein